MNKTEDQNVKDITERALFPWTQNKAQVGTASKENRIKYFQTQYFDSLASRAALYYRAPAGNRSEIGSSEIYEAEVLQVLYQKFGIKPWEAEDLDANWVNEIIIIISAENKATEEKSKRGR